MTARKLSGSKETPGSKGSHRKHHQGTGRPGGRHNRPKHGAQPPMTGAYIVIGNPFTEGGSSAKPQPPTPR